MDDDLAITLGILLAVDEATARRIAENLGHTFGTTAGKGANQALNKTVQGGKGEASKAGGDAGKAYSKGFASQMRSLERIIAGAVKTATSNAAKAAETQAVRAAETAKRRTVKVIESEKRETAVVTSEANIRTTRAVEAAKRRTVKVIEAGKQETIAAAGEVRKQVATHAEGEREKASKAIEEARRRTSAIRKEDQRQLQDELAGDTASRQRRSRQNARELRDRISDERRDRQAGQKEVDRERVSGLEDLSGVRRSNNEAENLYKSSNAKILADAKRHNAAMIASDQQSAVRRTVRIRTALNNLTRVNQSVMTAILTAWRSHHQRRIADEQSANRKAEIELQGSMDRRLAKIKAGSRQQSLAATANATASERANTAISGGVLGAVTGRGMGVASLFAGALGGREIFNILGEFQSIETAFKGIFREVDGGAPRTTQFLKDMQAFARETPFTLSQVSLAAQKMFANRIVDAQDIDATEQLTDKLRRLADAAAATGKTAGQMDMALLGITQIGSTGQLMMEELRQVTENIGLPMEEVAKSLGMTVAEMRDAMKEGAIGAEEGLDAIFDALTRIPGAAGASARQAKTLRGAMSQLRDVGEQLVIKFLMPVGNAFSAAALAMGKFGDQLLSGRGAWKVARDALGGIVGALTAIIAAKGAIQVVKLLGIGLSAIAAAPVTAALVALVGVLSTFDGLRAKLASLVEGTKNWFLVGYRANTVIDSFSGFVKVITTVGKFARTVQDFTKALVVGTKDWFLVGYRISGVIDEFSNIVLFQTSLGAAARVIVDALRGIWDALGALAQTRDFGEFRKALGRIAEDAGKALSPIKDALAEQFSKGVDAAKAAAGKAVKAVVGWLGDNMDSLVAGARVASGGALILKMLGLAKGGNFLGAAQLGIGVAIAGALIGAARSLAKDQTAEEFGKQINEFLQKGIDRAFDAAVIIAAVVGKLGSLVGDVWGALFGGEGGGDTAADPKASISIAAKIAATITAAWKKATENLGNLASAIGTWFTESFTAWIVDFPYEVGRKLSSTIFQDEVFKALGTAAAAAAAAGLFIAGQFALGFLLGMVDAAPELGGMLKDAFTGALGRDIGTAFAGSILLGMGVVFAGVKLRRLAGAAAAKVAAPFRKFSIGFNASGVSDARIAIAGIKPDLESTGSKAADLGMKVARISDAAGKATSGLASLTERSGRNMQALGAQVAGVQGKFQSAGGAIIQAGKSTNAATVTGFGGAGSNMEKFREAVGRALVAIGGRLERLPEQIRTVAARVRKGWDAIGGAAGAAQSAVGIAVTGITAYYSSMSEDTATRVAGYLATVGQIAAVWAANGPIVGAVAAGAAVIGYFQAVYVKGAKKVAEAISRQAEATKASMEGIGSSVTRTFEELGNTGATAQRIGILDAIKDGAAAGNVSLIELRDRYGITIQDMADLSAQGGDAIQQAFLKATRGVASDALMGDVSAINTVLAEMTENGTNFEKLLNETFTQNINKAMGETRLSADELLGSMSVLHDVMDGKVSQGGMKKALDDLGLSAGEIDAVMEAATDTLQGFLAYTDTGAFMKALGPAMDKAIEDFRTQKLVTDELKQAMERAKTPVDRFVSAWERVKEAIDDTANSFRAYLDQVLGRELTLDNTTLAILSSAEAATRPRAEGEIEARFNAEREVATTEARFDVADAAAIFARESRTVEDAIAKTQQHIDGIIAGVSDPAMKEFLKGLKEDPKVLEAIRLAFADQNPIDDFTEFKERYGDLIKLVENKPIADAIAKGIIDGNAREAIIKSLQDLEKESPELEAYIVKAGGGDKGKGYDAVYQEIISDVDYLTGLNPTITVQFDFLWGKVREHLNSILPPFLRLPVPVAANYDGGYIPNPTLSTLAERGAEAVFPLTNPSRMRQIMGIPQVARAFDAAGFGAPIAGNSTGTNYAPVTVDQSQVNHFTIASDTPRATADQIVRRQRSARFLGGHTLPVVIR